MEICRRGCAVLIIVLGVGIICYPFFSDRLFERQAKKRIQENVSTGQMLQKEEIVEQIRSARAYNQGLLQGSGCKDPFSLQEKGNDTYDKILSCDNSGIMGYLTIPCISLEYPIYHGTDVAVLEKGIGHVQGSSFPVGGEGTHALLAGHSGVTHRRLFTDIENLKQGDMVCVNVLNEIYTYRVESLKVVAPDDLSQTEIEPDKDLLTLITCTPYGINSHRLLVRCVRYESQEKNNEMPPFECKTRSTYETNLFKDYLVTGAALIIMTGAFFVIFAKSRNQFK